MNPPHRLNLIFLLGLLLSITCAGCILKSTQNEDTATTAKPEAQIDHPGAIYAAGDAAYPDGYYIHTVTLPYESISIIAKWFTGDLKNWEKLAACNPDINPNRIFLGNEIKIPRVLMTRHTPMTREFVEESQPQPKRKKVISTSDTKPTPTKPEATPPAPTTPEPAVDEEPLLFGPKGYSTD